MMKMKLKAGYKQTEVGVIPNDWEVKRLSETGSFTKGSGVRKDEALSGDIPCVRYGELYTRHSDYIKQFYSFISKDISETAKKLKIGDILFAGSGETKDEIGKSAAFINEFEAYAGGDIVILSPTSSNPLYLGYLLNAPFIQKQKASRGQGDAVVHISATQLGNVCIPLPPTKAEQTAIANALSDADALISSLEKLIEKKRNIKQGAMQQLLKPKKGWVVKKLGEICTKVTTGRLDANAMRVDGEYRFYTCAKSYYHIDVYAFDDEALLVSGNGENVGYVHYFKGKFNAYQRTYVLLGFNESINYIKLYLDRYLPERISQEANSGNTPYIKMGTLTDMEIIFPDSLKEQNEIADILIDMDNEISSLEKKLSKSKMLKQGMMQELLTGKIRLV